jgi:cytochrome c-type biogenesis protein CcmH/NrfG
LLVSRGAFGVHGQTTSGSSSESNVAGFSRRDGALSRWRIRLKTVLVCSLVVNPAVLIFGQTYHVGGSSSENPQTEQPAEGSQKPLGWGSNIENARLARAAEMALKNGKYAEATDYAQRAAQAAPADPQLWFLLGYAARLAVKSTLSVEAYNHGLHLQPASLEGLSGLAQTYARMGKRDEAAALLTRIVTMAPKRIEFRSLRGMAHSIRSLRSSGEHFGAHRTNPAFRPLRIVAGA